MKTTPFWWEDAPKPIHQNDPLPSSVDVAVIGAGYSGLNTALILARAGLSVAVFEAGQFGDGASSRNGGMVGPSFHKLGIAGLKTLYGEDRANDIIRESVGFVDFLENFLKDESIDTDFARKGRFRGALTPAHHDAMARQLETFQQACDVKGHMVPKNNVADETGSKSFHGGVVYEIDGGLNPAKYLWGLLGKVKDAGASVFEQHEVTAINRQDGKFEVVLKAGNLRAEHVAICTNGYTGKQFKHLHRRVLPLRSAMIATEELDAGTLQRLMPKGRVYGDSRRIVAYYRPSPDGKRIVFGSRASGLKDNPHKNAKQLHAAMSEIYPDLKNTAITHVWSGLVAYSFDHAPHIGEMNGLHFAMGYCGSGVARATYFGQKLGYKILNQQERGQTAFDDLTFQTKRFYNGNPWFMPAILSWHRLADRWRL